MSERLDIPVELGDPLANFLSKKPNRIIKKDIISFTTAIGLALRQVDNNF
jgi:Tfp pilus assembly PilM family ATPase